LSLFWITLSMLMWLPKNGLHYFFWETHFKVWVTQDEGNISCNSVLWKFSPSLITFERNLSISFCDYILIVTSAECYLDEVVHVLFLCSDVLLDFKSNCTFMFKKTYLCICHITTNSAPNVFVYEPMIQHGEFSRGFGNGVLLTICLSGIIGLTYTCYTVKLKYHIRK
jgi:hypothetical protein